MSEDNPNDRRVPKMGPANNADQHLIWGIATVVINEQNDLFYSFVVRISSTGTEYGVLRSTSYPCSLPSHFTHQPQKQETKNARGLG